MIALNMVGTTAEVQSAVTALTASDAFEEVIIDELKAYITAQLTAAGAPDVQFSTGPVSIKLHVRCNSITNHVSLVLQAIRLVTNDQVVALPNAETPAS